MSEHESAIVSVTRRIIEIMEDMLHTTRLGQFRALEVTLQDQLRLQADVLDDMDGQELEEYDAWLRDNHPLYARMTGLWAVLVGEYELYEETIREYEGFEHLWRSAIGNSLRGG